MVEGQGSVVWCSQTVSHDLETKQQQQHSCHNTRSSAITFYLICPCAFLQKILMHFFPLKEVFPIPDCHHGDACY